MGIIDSLTGVPLDDDELLFCIPVCAPYNTLNNYKLVYAFFVALIDALNG